MYDSNEDKEERFRKSERLSNIALIVSIVIFLANVMLLILKLK
jgi:flagellar basal body-associated protein FliL